MMVEIFGDRVEISNPGCLPEGLTEKNLGTKSVLRNKVIADLLHRADYIERMGTGIIKVRELMADAKLEAPIFESTPLFFTATFKRSPLHVPVTSDSPLRLPEGLTKKEMRICVLISENTKITIVEMAERLEIGEATVNRVIKSLTDRCILKRVGSDKKGSWVLMDR